MKYLPPEKLLELSLSAAEVKLSPIAINLSRPFIHEQFTQLFYTPIYHDLDRKHRCRYNQLSGMSGNELFMMFESGFTNRMIRRLLKHRVLKRDSLLKECLEIMLQEEQRHSKMFAAVNRKCMPQTYADSPFYFTRFGLIDNMALWCLTHLPHHLLVILWLVLIMEEFSNYISRCMISQHESNTLGPLEDTFIELHRLHLQDEFRHVQIDANLIDRLGGEASMLKRNSNAGVLRYLMRQILTPKRAGVAVITHLVKEFPELALRETELLRQLQQLKTDPGFGRAIRHASEMKLTRLFMTLFPEFQFINEYAQ